MKDDKYITFKRSEFYQMMGELALPPWQVGDDLLGSEADCAPIAKRIEEVAETICLQDATVIRGQDLFAAPALDAYAAMIAIVMKFGGMTPETRKELQQAADYFHDRANESRDIAFKTPDNGGLR